MNFRRGLLRGWVLLTILWLLTLTGIAAFLSGSSTNTRYYYNSNSGVVVRSLNDIPNRVMQELLSRDSMTAIIETEDGSEIVVPLPTDDKVQLNAEMKKLTPMVIAAYRKLDQKHTMDRSLGWVAVAAMPPILVLVAGFAVAWVVRGFR